MDVRECTRMYTHTLHIPHTHTHTLQHDTPSRYTLMGGPLLNLKGELIGMNIARVNRAENYALPISVVQKSVQNILKNTPQPGK